MGEDQQCTSPVTWAILMHNDDKMVVGIKCDGKVEFGPGFDAGDEVAILFWESLGKNLPPGWGMPPPAIMAHTAIAVEVSTHDQSGVETGHTR